MTIDATDRLEIMEALSKYTWGYDAGEFDLMRDCFAENATSGGEVSGTDVKWGPMEGRDENLSVLEGIRAGQKDQRRHNVSNFQFKSQTATTATYRVALSLLATEGGVTKVVTGGYYEIDAVKDGDTWRMSRLDGVLDAPF